MKNSPLLGTTARYVRGLLVTPRTWRDGARPLATWWQTRPETSETWRRRFARACPFPLVLERALLADAKAARNLPVARLRRFIDQQPETRALYARYLSTFENAVAHVVADAPIFAALAALFPALVAGVPVAARPPALFEAATVRQHTVLAAVHARLLVATLAVFQTRGRAGATLDDVERVTYLATLFGDTHLDLLAAAARYGRGDDCFWFGVAPPRVGAAPTPAQTTSTPLAAVYPMPHRVDCFDELPNMGALLVGADLLVDTGRQKRPLTLLRTITHVFLCKTMPQICHVRHIVSAIRNPRVCVYPTVARLAERVVAVVLLGNVPGATNRLGLAARIRFALALRRDPLVDACAPRHPDAPDDAFWAWAERHKMVLLFALREHFVTVCENEGVSDALLGRHVKWHDYKRVVRDTVARIRSALSAQAAADFSAPTRWDAREVRAATDEGQTQALETCSKILKGRAASLIRKKMVATTRRLVLHYALLHLGAHPPLLAALRAVQPGDAGRACVDTLAQALADGTYVPHAPRGRALCAALNVALGTGKDDGALGERDDAVRSLLPPSAAAALARFPARRVVREHLLYVAYVARAEARLAPVARELHMAASFAARRSMAHDASAHERATPQLRWLQALGMSRAGCDAVRHWVFDYVVLHAADDRYQQRSFVLGCASLDDFVLVKAYFHLYEQYQATAGQRVVFRPIGEAQRQLSILRASLAIEPFEPSPPELGVALLCASCGRWATAVQEAPAHVVPDYDIVLAAELVRRRRPAPKRIERRQARLRQIQTTEAARLGRPTALPPGAHPLVELGESSHFLDLNDGACYCSRGKPEKTALADQRRAATLAPAQTAANVEEEEEEEEEEDIGVDYGLALEILEERVLEVSDAHSALQIARAVAGRVGGDASAKSQKKRKKKRSDVPPPLSRFIGLHERAMMALPEARLVQGTRGCASEPLLSVDMVGIWYRVAGVYYGLCCYCGNLTRVAAEKMTSRGLSCMNHAHPELGALHPHATGFTPPQPLRAHQHGMVLRRPVRCAACAAYATVTAVRVFDGVYRVYEMPLCRVHIGAISRLAPLLAAGRRETGRAVAPIPLVDVLVALGNARAQGQQRAKEKRAAVPTTSTAKTTTTTPGTTRAIFARLAASSRLQAALAACAPNVRDAFTMLYLTGGRTQFDAADSAVVLAVAEAMSALPRPDAGPVTG